MTVISCDILIKRGRAISSSSAPCEVDVNNSNYIICRCRSESKSVSVIIKDMLGIYLREKEGITFVDRQPPGGREKGE